MWTPVKSNGLHVLIVKICEVHLESTGVHLESTWSLWGRVKYTFAGTTAKIPFPWNPLNEPESPGFQQESVEDSKDLPDCRKGPWHEGPTPEDDGTNG